MNLDKKSFLISIASGIFIGAALFDTLPEAKKSISFLTAVLYLLVGVIIWYILKKITGLISHSGFAFVSALGFWLHSMLEGSVVALSFLISAKVGLIVALAMLLHLFPEFFAIVAILRGEKVSYKKSIMVDIGGILLLVISSIGLYFFLPSIPAHLLAVIRAIIGGAFLYIGAVSFWKQRKIRYAFFGLAAGLLVAALWTFL